jgi:2-hydroxychromene-2-carboxylate isomerase
VAAEAGVAVRWRRSCSGRFSPPIFTKAVYAAEFGEGRPIADAGMLQGILRGLGLDPDTVLRSAQGDANKTRLKATGEEARSRGVFGAPTFFTEDGEMFWGNDRLEQAAAWAAGERPARAERAAAGS